MSSLVRFLFASAAFLSLAQAAPICNSTTTAASTTLPPICSSTTTATSTPLPPSKDPWYSPREGFKTAVPGTVLDARVIPGDLKSVMPSYAASAYNILYATTDSQYNPTWAVTTLFVPTNPDTSALISYQLFYDSANIDASPSYTLYNTSLDQTAKAIRGLEAILLQGRYFVNLPDYEGPNASFAAGVMSGHATLDSIRAAISFGKLCFSFTDEMKYAMWGYSGGAFATEWAAELQVQYAPEMNFAGAAIGGLTPNLTNVLQRVDGTPYAGLIPAAILGMSSQYPKVRGEILNSLKTTGQNNKETFLSVVNMTLSVEESAFANKNIADYFINGKADLMSPSVMEVLYRDGIMGYHGVPQMPLYVYQSTKDEVSPICDTINLMREYCNMGVDVELDLNTALDHAHEGGDQGVNLQAFVWLSGVFQGTHVRSESCTSI